MPEKSMPGMILKIALGENETLRNALAYADTQAIQDRQTILRLRKEIEVAPHNMGCNSLQGGPTTPGWGVLENCDCWKRRTLEGKND